MLVLLRYIRCTVYFLRCFLIFFIAASENKRCTCVGYSLLVIREMESFVVSAAAKRWNGNLCYTVVSPIYTIFALRITHFSSIVKVVIPYHTCSFFLWVLAPHHYRGIRTTHSTPSQHDLIVHACNFLVPHPHTHFRNKKVPCNHQPCCV